MRECSKTELFSAGAVTSWKVPPVSLYNFPVTTAGAAYPNSSPRPHLLQISVSHLRCTLRCYIAGMRCLAYLLLSCYSLQAQAPAYEYTGSPLAIPYTCTEDDIDWGGLTCVDEPCPIYIDVTHAAGQGKSILISGNFHASAVTMYSLLLRSEDNGRTWREPFERIRGAELDAIQV